MSRTSLHDDQQAVPLSDPEAPPLNTNAEEDDGDPEAHNSATLEQNKSLANNRRHDNR